MKTHTNNGEPTPNARPPREERKWRFVRWQTIHRDLPDIPDDIADDIFWKGGYEPLKPESGRFLEERGVRGVLWP